MERIVEWGIKMTGERERERSKEYNREEEGMVECEVKYISKER